MNYAHDVEEILIRAEGELRALIEHALAAQRYRDVATVAAVADKVADLVTTLEDTANEAVSPHSSGVTTIESPKMHDGGSHDSEESEARTNKRSRRETYPYFERDGDKLVKIGWSKKDRRTYEHRASKNAVLAVSSAIERFGDGIVFTMDGLLPVEDGGQEVPSYQAYLALAWLRTINAVRRKGKEGYVTLESGCSNEKVEHAWNELNER